MTTIAIGLGVGVFYMALRLYESNKRKKELDKALLSQKCEVYQYSKWIPYAMFAIAIISAITAYIGYANHNDLDFSFGILLVFLSLTEGYCSIDFTKLYYNEHGVIIQGKYIRYKSMKSIKKKLPIPFSGWNLQTYQNEKNPIHYEVAKFLEEKGNVKVVHKQD